MAAMLHARASLYLNSPAWLAWRDLEFDPAERRKAAADCGAEIGLGWPRRHLDGVGDDNTQFRLH